MKKNAKKQEEHDEELALNLQRQFEIEEDGTSHNAQITNQQESDENTSSGHTVYSYSFGSDPSNMITIRNSTTRNNNVHNNNNNNNDIDNENFDPYSLLSHFNHNNDNDENSSFSPFFDSLNPQFGISRRFGSSSGRRRNNRDPLEQMFGMPLLRMGGMGMPFVDVDNLDHDQLLRLFPDVPRGASEEHIQSLPENTYTGKPKEKEKGKDKEEEKGKEKGKGKEEENEKEKEKKPQEKSDDQVCCICLEEFKNGDPIRRLPCLHIFHKNEIDTWLRRNHVCPICRIPIDEQPNLQQN